MKLIFDKQGNLLIATSSVVPSSHDNDDYVIADLAENEKFDSNYNYVINLEGFATKGTLNPINHLEIAQMEANFASTQYQRDRRSAYPSFENQFDLLYHGGYDAWKAKIESIKNQFPKPT